MSLIICIVSVNGKLEIKKDTVSESLRNLTYKIIKENMNGYNCLLWLSEKNAKYPVNLASQDFPLPVLSSDTSSQLDKIIVDVFKLQCKGYLIQTPDPGYFLKLWELERQVSIDRHSPRMIFLPWNDTVPNSNNLFRLPETQFHCDLLLIEINGRTTGENNFFNIVTNNFYTPFDQENRKPGLLLGVWPIDTNIDFFPDKIFNLEGKTIRTGIIQYPPFTIVEPFGGVEPNVVQIFCEIHNCSIAAVTDNHLWGEIWENKSGNGM
ncbi:hypothetical protein O3M35_000573 [Rhynocoris fuscipes]|uniref:CN hydrolase domain-containing protein n=1 Tax=Rhynocoris fuscipes TaxID=488301 RepID=A0AAW1DSZ8_9HEMI